MSSLKRLARKLKPNYVNAAIMVHDKRKELALQMIKDRAAYDKEFCNDLIKAVGDNLPKDIREIADKTILSPSIDAPPTTDIRWQYNNKIRNECSVADVPPEELQYTLDVLSERQSQLLENAGIQIPESNIEFPKINESRHLIN